MAIDQTERAARNRSLFREVNERVVELEQSGLQETNGDGSTVRAVCECAGGACHAPIDLSIDAYQAVRSSPLLFLVRAGHEWPDAGRVVSEHECYVVFEKVGRSDLPAIEHEVNGRAGTTGDHVIADRGFDGGWHPGDLMTLVHLRESLKARVEVGDPQALPTFQVVVAFIAELEESGVAGSDFER
jgi:hypothetical protein